MLAKQTTSIIKIQVNQSSEAQLFWGGYQEDFSLRSTWPRALCLVNFPQPWGEIVNFTILLVLLQKKACSASFCSFSTFLAQFLTITKLQRYSAFCTVFGVLQDSRSRQFIPRDQVSPLFSVMSVSTIGIVGDCFYLLIIYSEKFSAWVCRLQFALNVNLKLRFLIPLLTLSVLNVWNEGFRGHLYWMFAIKIKKTIAYPERPALTYNRSKAGALILADGQAKQNRKIRS